MSLKSLILTASLAILGAVSCRAADSLQTQPIGPFGGLNTNVSQEAIDATQSPDLLNVDISQGGKSVKKRQGYGLDTVLGSTEAAHNLYKFFDSSGNEIRLAFNDKLVSSSINGATWSVILTTGTKGATWDCTDYLGFAYCVSSAFDNPIKTNGTIAGTTGAGGTNAVPAGSLISNSGDRLLVAATAANPSRLYYSQSAVFSNFTLGVQPSDSSFEDIVAPGSKLTHIAYRFGKWLWWKDQSFGFIVGTGQFDLQIVTVSHSIGTLDNTDVFDGNYVYFRGSDSQIYTYDGSVLSRSISADIAPTLRQANKRKAVTWVQTTLADWQAGTTTVTTSNFSQAAGALTFSPSTGTTTAINTQFNTSNWSGGGATLPASGDLAQWIDQTGGGNEIYGRNAQITANYTTFFASFTYLVPASPGASTQLRWTPNSNIRFIIQSTFLGILGLGGGVGSCNGTIFPGVGTSHAIAFNMVNNSLNVYMDGALACSSSLPTPANQQVTNLNFSAAGGIAPNETDVSGFSFSGSSYTDPSGVFYSQVENAPNLTSWGLFSAVDQLSDGALAFRVRSSTSSFTILSSTPSWVSQTVGATVSASTGTYFQFSSTFTPLSQPVVLNSATFNWIEGSASDKMYGTYFNNAIWFSVSLGTATANNRIFRYDLLSNLWTLYDIPANGFLTYNNNLYFADPSAGKVYQFGNGVYSDNGSAINAYWKSKAFFGDSPFGDKDLRRSGWYVASDSGTILSLTYTFNEKTTATQTLNLYDSNKNVIHKHWNFPLGSVAINFNAQFGDNSTNPPWEVFGGMIQFVPRPWEVDLQ